MTGKPVAAASLDATRAKLADMRETLLRGLVRDGLNGGNLALLASIGGALDALDHAPVKAESAERAVVSDDRHRLRLVLYRGADEAAAIDLEAVDAIGLAGKLIEAAQRRLPR